MSSCSRFECRQTPNPSEIAKKVIRTFTMLITFTHVYLFFYSQLHEMESFAEMKRHHSFADRQKKRYGYSLSVGK